MRRRLLKVLDTFTASYPGFRRSMRGISSVSPVSVTCCQVCDSQTGSPDIAKQMMLGTADEFLYWECAISAVRPRPSRVRGSVLLRKLHETASAPWGQAI